jgi:ribosome biogenesis GTPase A
MPRALAEEATIQWYPGHMARAMRRLAEDMRAIDIVVEVTDARVPLSGTNPALGELAGHRPRLLVLSRAQLAEDRVTEAWLAYYRKRGRTAIAVDAKDRSGAARLRAAVDALATGRRSSRVIVLGIPNAGKSTAINGLAGKNVARAEDRAGVTRARQWFRMSDSLEIMDTAGILVPKIDTPDAQWKLALVGAVPRARFDAEDVLARFYRWLREARPETTVPDLETFAQTRGFMKRGTLVNTHNAAWAYLKDLGDGKFGRMSFEEPGLTT